MGLALVMATTMYVKADSGQMAGMSNTILEPKLTTGVRGLFNVGDSPFFVAHDTYLIVGKSLTGTEVTPVGAQELRGQEELLYRIPTGQGGESLAIGPYFEFALPFHHYQPYFVQTETGSYAAEEGDVLKRQLTYGVDFRFDIQGERVESTLRNVWYFGGSRIGPNLLTYQPLAGLLWDNRYTLIGSSAAPKLQLGVTMDFYFAKKANTSTMNLHDGLGGTKRELYVEFGLGYNVTPEDRIDIESHGANNLNRGDSTTVPVNFRDGFSIGYSHRF